MKSTSSRHHGFQHDHLVNHPELGYSIGYTLSNSKRQETWPGPKKEPCKFARSQPFVVLNVDTKDFFYIGSSNRPMAAEIDPSENLRDVERSRTLAVLGDVGIADH